MYAYKAQRDEELSLREGDIINVLNSEGDWWEGELKGKRGLVPGNLMALLS
jgi:SH3 domain-containing kinase-binding protein 1